MKLKFHKFADDAILPTRSHEDDAGLDMYAAEDMIVTPNNNVVRLGVGVEIPRGYVGLLLPRSSMNKKGIVTLLGVIDSGYTGEVKATFFPATIIKARTRISMSYALDNLRYCDTSENSLDYNINIFKGDRVCQLVVVPIMCVDACWDTEKEEERGINGFGSTGR